MLGWAGRWCAQGSAPPGTRHPHAGSPCLQGHKGVGGGGQAGQVRAVSSSSSSSVYILQGGWRPGAARGGGGKWQGGGTRRLGTRGEHRGWVLQGVGAEGGCCMGWVAGCRGGVNTAGGGCGGGPVGAGCGCRWWGRSARDTNKTFIWISNFGYQATTSPPHPLRPRSGGVAAQPAAHLRGTGWSRSCRPG